MNSEIDAHKSLVEVSTERPINEARENARMLLRRGCTGIIGLRKRWGHVGPFLFTSEEHLEDLVLEPKYLLSDILRRILEHDMGGNFGILVRGCDFRALMGLERRGVVDLERVFVVGVVCDAEMAERCDCLHPEAPVAVVDDSFCVGCGVCEQICEYDAPKLEEGEAGIQLSHIDEVLCKGCGVCIAACPSRAITMKHPRRDTPSAQMDAVLMEGWN